MLYVTEHTQPPGTYLFWETGCSGNPFSVRKLGVTIAQRRHTFNFVPTLSLSVVQSVQFAVNLDTIGAELQ